jgi:hypothetical protein
MVKTFVLPKLPGSGQYPIALSRAAALERLHDPREAWMFTSEDRTAILTNALTQFPLRQKWLEHRMNVVGHYAVGVEPISVFVQFLQANCNGLGYSFVLHPHRARRCLVHYVFEFDEPVAVEMLNPL